MNSTADFEGFLILQSVAGGTGSGLGARLSLRKFNASASSYVGPYVAVTLGAFVTEALRKRYPDAILINVAVWPFTAGEVCVQQYNAVLSLASLTKVRKRADSWSARSLHDFPSTSCFSLPSQASDCVLLLENDVANQVCKKLLNIASPRFPDLNRILAKTLCMFLLPSYAAKSRGSKPSAPVDMATLILNLCSHPVRRDTFAP